jgi:hypothetical protein
MQTEQIARLSNLVGGSLVLLSTLLPWIIVGPNLQFLFLSSGPAWVALVLVLVGGVVSLRSRYGGLVTTLGLVTYLLFGGTVPRSSFYPVEYSFGPGLWLAWLGAPITLLGLSSNSSTLSLELPNPIRWLIPPLGTLLAVLGGVLLYSELIVRAPIQALVSLLALPITGVLAALVGMTRGSVLVDRHPQLG